MTDGNSMRIIVHPNGPYRVLGGVPLTVQTISANKEGESWDWIPGRSFKVGAEYFLCRCGQSANKPFCDNSHLTAGFAGQETASRRPIERQSQHFDGPTHVLSDAENLCAFARFCDPKGKIWALIGQTDRPEIRDLVIREASHCPAGRLVLHEKATGKVVEPRLPPSIGLIEDPEMECSGPLWVRGGIPIESSNGVSYQLRNRVTLCRCGASTNMPFCNGSHASIRFRDGLV
ncbi:MAG: CDGSH iron-sulfur domain-containing protein [Thermoplasmata archaeon]|nr:CDGSH iron-sulfur domain-containing protein [Thermoplasmata archaeon]